MLRQLLPYIAYFYVTLVGWTTRVSVIRGENRERLRREGRRFIYAFWHQRQVFFTWSHRGDPAAILVSRSQDGELIAATMRLSRIGSVRGSSSRGGVAAVKEMMEIFDSGRDIGMTPDGPKGPAREVKDGVLFLAQKLGAPVLPLTNGLTSKLVLEKAWDRFHVPLPFGRAFIVYGEPLEIGPHDDLEAKGAALKAELDRITEEADRLTS